MAPCPLATPLEKARPPMFERNVGTKIDHVTINELDRCVRWTYTNCLALYNNCIRTNRCETLSLFHRVSTHAVSTL